MRHRCGKRATTVGTSRSGVYHWGAAGIAANYQVTWTVEAVDEMLPVPAGTFACLRVRRLQTGYSSSDERHWFARGVGKVREIGLETKELTSFEIP